MKAVLFTALIAAAILLMGPAQAVTTTQYVEFDTVLVIYKHYDRYGDDTIVRDIDAAETSEIETEVVDAVEWMWRATNLQCLVKVIETIHIERELTLDQIHEMGAGSGNYWLAFWRAPGQTTSVEDDLYDAGYVDGDISIVLVTYPWKSSAGAINPYGAAMYGPPVGCMGDASYVSVLVVDGPYVDKTIIHEVGHVFDVVLDLVGYPDAMVGIHTPGNYNGLIDCEGQFFFRNMDDVLWSEWSDIYSYWAATQTVTDADGDGIPASGSLPITEATLGSSDTDTDSDNDGLGDFDEVQATFWAMTDLNDTDTDDDGTGDNSDPYPLSVIDNTSIKKGNAAQLTVDGEIKNGEKYVKVVNFNGTDADISVDIWVSHKADVLYIAADVTDEVLYAPGYNRMAFRDHVEIQFDAEEDGYMLQGTSNYRLTLCPKSDAGKATVELDGYYTPGTFHEMGTTGIDAEYTTSGGTYDGYIMEVSITEAALENSLQFNPGNDLRLTFNIHDADGYGYWTNYNLFTGIDYEFKYANEFVTLSLTN